MSFIISQELSYLKFNRLIHTNYSHHIAKLSKELDNIMFYQNNRDIFQLKPSSISNSVWIPLSKISDAFMTWQACKMPLLHLENYLVSKIKFYPNVFFTESLLSLLLWIIVLSSWATFFVTLPNSSDVPWQKISACDSYVYVYFYMC